MIYTPTLNEGLIEDINQILDTTWTPKQLMQGKWIEVNESWTNKDIAAILIKYRAAGWHVTHEVEVTPGLTRKYLSFVHPRYVKLRARKH